MYIEFSESEKEKLRRPFDKKATVEKVINSKRKIIAVGDDTTLRLIKARRLPHLAVCDFRIKRKAITKKQREIIKRAYSRNMVTTYKNPAGTLSLAILKNAKKHIKKGGLIRIIGEEDITALAFMLFAGKDYLILYGQPNEGVVIVKPEKKKLKTKIKKILPAAAFHHKEQRSTSTNRQ